MLTWSYPVKGFFIMTNIYSNPDDPYLESKNYILLLVIAAILAVILGFGILFIQDVFAKEIALESAELPSIEGNSLVAVSKPQGEIKVVKKVKMMATAYSSTVGQTDSTPFITASGSTVRDGIVANNMLPFGTEIKIPELYGDKVFVVEDRMNKKKGIYHVDIWFPEYDQAKEFGAKTIYIEVLSS